MLGVSLVLVYRPWGDGLWCVGVEPQWDVAVYGHSCRDVMLSVGPQVSIRDVCGFISFTTSYKCIQASILQIRMHEVLMCSKIIISAAAYLFCLTLPQISDTCTLDMTSICVFDAWKGLSGGTSSWRAGDRASCHFKCYCSTAPFLQCSNQLIVVNLNSECTNSRRIPKVFFTKAAFNTSLRLSKGPGLHKVWE